MPSGSGGAAPKKQGAFYVVSEPSGSDTTTGPCISFLVVLSGTTATIHRRSGKGVEAVCTLPFARAFVDSMVSRGASSSWADAGAAIMLELRKPAGRYVFVGQRHVTSFRPQEPVSAFYCASCSLGRRAPYALAVSENWVYLLGRPGPGRPAAVPRSVLSHQYGGDMRAFAEAMWGEPAYPAGLAKALTRGTRVLAQAGRCPRGARGSNSRLEKEEEESPPVV